MFCITRDGRCLYAFILCRKALNSFWGRYSLFTTSRYPCSYKKLGNYESLEPKYFVCAKQPIIVINNLCQLCISKYSVKHNIITGEYLAVNILPLFIPSLSTSSGCVVTIVEHNGCCALPKLVLHIAGAVRLTSRCKVL